LARKDSRGTSKSDGAKVSTVTAASNNVGNGLGGVTAALADGDLGGALGGRSNLSLGGGDLNTAGSSLNTNSLYKNQGEIMSKKHSVRGRAFPFFFSVGDKPPENE
jgi:hypothetical protein